VHKLKIIVLYIAKYLGLFAISKKITSHGLRILCYHGFSLADEDVFRPKLFITGALFARRLAKISDMGFSVIGLDKAVDMIKTGTKFSNSIVLTIDDGWQGVGNIAWPLLKQHGYDWTLYLTTYYAEKQTQVMNVAIQYLCWKSEKQEIDLSLTSDFFKQYKVLQGLKDLSTIEKALQEIGNELSTHEERQDFLRRIACAFNLAQDEFEKNRLFYLLDMPTIKHMHEDGVDIQLHTHRHDIGVDNIKTLTMEITENRQSIQSVCDHQIKHFCYPSGFYTQKHIDWLPELGVVSATTCKPGLNYSTTPLLELGRFLDGANISDIEFEAELSGFSELLRKLK
jgi:peptidoglycan/xylan/chitin deacetylase (PgdA/CDA1 family)